MKNHMLVVFVITDWTSVMKQNITISLQRDTQNQIKKKKNV